MAKSKDVSQGAEWVSCPNPECQWHWKGSIPKGMRWYRRHGYYDSAQHGKVARYVCRNCHKTFSERTLENDFYLHFDEFSINDIGLAWLRGETLKDIARERGITVQMVRTRLRRFEPYAEGQTCGWQVAESGDPDKAS